MNADNTTLNACGICAMLTMAQTPAGSDEALLLMFATIALNVRETPVYVTAANPSATTARVTSALITVDETNPDSSESKNGTAAS
jgi:hypothetical protein